MIGEKEVRIRPRLKWSAAAFSACRTISVRTGSAPSARSGWALTKRVVTRSLLMRGPRGVVRGSAAEEKNFVGWYRGPRGVVRGSAAEEKNSVGYS